MRHKAGFYERYIKRPQDFVLALMAIIVLSPIILVTSVLVRIKLGKPVFFSQKRPGIDGKPFMLHKFRTMIDAYDMLGNPLPDEQRMTSFGNKLRATSLDELPELFNILKGDMSFVGPRPLLMQYITRYNKSQMRRHEVRPGLTGLAQIHGRNATTWDKRFEWDTRYVDNVTFLGDWRIIFKTVRLVLKREGISGEGVATMSEFHGNK